MAGMLPGVETARKRRIHHSHGCCQSRHSSFSLFSINSSASFSSCLESDGVDEKLGQIARDAKQRLDQKLRPRSTSLFTRNNSDVGEKRVSEKVIREVRTEVYGSKKKKNEKEEKCICAVCLEEFRVGENVVKLLCTHNFHSRCMLPWLPTHPLCPCCRTCIFP